MDDFTNEELKWLLTGGQLGRLPVPALSKLEGDITRVVSVAEALLI